MTPHLFDTDIYQARRQALCEGFTDGKLLFLGNNYLPRNYKGNDFLFRQDSNFLYFFGLAAANLAAIIDAATGETVLYGDELTMADVVWTGPQPPITALAKRVGIQEVKPYKALKETLAAQASDFHFLPPCQAGHQMLLADAFGVSVAAVLEHTSPSLIAEVVRIRCRKSKEEVAEMSKALVITDAMHRAAIQRTRAGMREAELVGVLTGIAHSLGAGLAYNPIVTKNGHILHNHDHHHQLREGDLVLGDFGAESLFGYAADITRTWPVSQRFTDRQRAIYEIVLLAEEQAIAASKPGVPYCDLHLQAAKIITTGLQDLGLMRGDADEAVTQGAHALFFPHGLGHMIGLDVHDMEGLGEDYVGYDDDYKRSDQFGLSYLRLGRELQEGFVVTVEPGIYFIPELIRQWAAEKKHTAFINYDALDHWLDFGGIRIEDNILITDNGQEILGPPIPKSVKDVEALRKG